MSTASVKLRERTVNGELSNMIRLLSGQAQPTVSLDGVVQAYYPTASNGGQGGLDITAGTVDVAIGQTAGLTSDVDPDSDGPQILQNVPLFTPAYGFQHGPLIGARCTVFVRQGGVWGAHLHHGDDDSPGAPAGETWMVHYAKGLADLTVQAFAKLTNHGENEGDGAGGLRLGATSFTSIVTALMMLGAEGLDKDGRAGMARDDVDAAIQSYHDNTIAPLCDRLQSGSGVPPPEYSADVTGSSIVKIAP